MATLIAGSRTARFRTGWITLLVAAVLMTLNHSMMMFAGDNPVLFLGYAAFTLYALLVIALPLRRGEAWAWYTTWLLPIGLALGAALAGDPNQHHAPLLWHRRGVRARVATDNRSVGGWCSR